MICSGVYLLPFGIFLPPFRPIISFYLDQFLGGRSVDIQTTRIAVEVETPETVPDAMSQLQGHRRPVYIAGTNQEAVEKALEITKGTTVGVMDNQETL